MTEERYKNEDIKAKCKAFGENVNKVLGKACNPDDFKDNLNMLDMDTPTYNMYEDNDKGAYSQVVDIDGVSHNTYNCYVGAEVELLIGDKVMSGKVRRQKREHGDSLKGMEHPNAILNTQMYEVEFPDGK